ncbi:MAG: SDR family oxidoreductase [Alphaproteobacteria bacterium]|nr:SDR family oxidoreductase [Alphaproteobacteria bacterium]
MARLLEGRVALITGAGRGQGLSAAQLFADNGAKLVITDLDSESVDAAVAAIADKGGDAVGSVGDVSKSEDVRAALALAKDRFGGLDILYNNAGIGFSAKQRMGVEMTDLVNCTEEDWDRIIAINLTGVFLMCKYGVPMLTERGGGVVINTASIGGLRGGPSAHAYAVSKAGVIHISRLIARTYGAKKIRANTICPGVIDTDMIHSHMLMSNAARDAISQATPIGRIGTPRDIAELALYLASDAASFITGQAIAIDGGMTA